MPENIPLPPAFRKSRENPGEQESWLSRSGAGRRTAAAATENEAGIGRSRQPAVLTYAFRPMFLAAGVWAIAAIAIWHAMLVGYLRLPTRFDPMGWHIHEMLFGFVMAAIAGFLLTAIPTWTGRVPVQGRPLALLAGLWLLGRIACLMSAELPAWLAIAADLSFPVLLLALAAREIVAGRSWRNLPMPALVGVFIVANLLMHLESIGVPAAGGFGWRLGVAVPVLLISVIGGRIIPNFTRNWLSKRRAVHLPAAHGAIDKAALGLLHAGFAVWAVLPDWAVTGVVLVIAGFVNYWRLIRWAGASTWAEPLLFILHLGYAWVAIGTALLGLSVLDAGVPAASALHALTVGAIGTMILAVMPRVTLGHTGRDLVASRATVAMFVLINAAAMTRVAASWNLGDMMILLSLSAGCWMAAFALFEIVYGPMLLTRGPASSGTPP